MLVQDALGARHRVGDAATAAHALAASTCARSRPYDHLTHGIVRHVANL